MALLLPTATTPKGAFSHTKNVRSAQKAFSFEQSHWCKPEQNRRVIRARQLSLLMSFFFFVKRGSFRTYLSRWTDCWRVWLVCSFHWPLGVRTSTRQKDMARLAGAPIMPFFLFVVSRITESSNDELLQWWHQTPPLAITVLLPMKQWEIGVSLYGFVNVHNISPLGVLGEVFMRLVSEDWQKKKKKACII